MSLIAIFFNIKKLKILDIQNIRKNCQNNLLLTDKKCSVLTTTGFKHSLSEAHAK